MFAANYDFDYCTNNLINKIILKIIIKINYFNLKELLNVLNLDNVSFSYN